MVLIKHIFIARFLSYIPISRCFDIWKQCKLFGILIGGQVGFGLEYEGYSILGDINLLSVGSQTAFNRDSTPATSFQDPLRTVFNLNPLNWFVGCFCFITQSLLYRHMLYILNRQVYPDLYILFQVANL